MPKSEKHLEGQFQSYFVAKTSECLKNAELIAKEFSLFPALSMLTRDFIETNQHSLKSSIGRVDLIFRYKGIEYIGEIKYYPFSNGGFWDALKVMGYTAYINWTKDSKSKYKPAIFLPIKNIKLEHQIVAGRLGITLFGITKDKNTFKVKMIEDKPIWKQD